MLRLRPSALLGHLRVGIWFYDAGIILFWVFMTGLVGSTVMSRGIPRSVADLTKTFAYNDLDETDELDSNPQIQVNWLN